MRDRTQRQRLCEVARVNRTGVPPKPCASCGRMPDPSLMERHHLDGRRASDSTDQFCLWCHDEEDAARYDLPLRLRRPRTREDRLLAILAGDARLFRRWGELFLDRAAWLERLIDKEVGEHE